MYILKIKGNPDGPAIMKDCEFNNAYLKNGWYIVPRDEASIYESHKNATEIAREAMRETDYIIAMVEEL